MEKVTINLVVPERIMALALHYTQCHLYGDDKQKFLDYLENNEVENPKQYLSEMEIGIIHPYDEPVKIMDFWVKENKEAYEWITKNYFPQYEDKILNEDLFGIELLDEELTPPQTVLELIQSVKSTDCSYFRFVNS